MKFQWRREWPLWLVIAFMFGQSLANWNSVPDRIPVHWGLDGQVDRYGGRLEGLLVLPIVAVVIYFVTLLVPRIDPGRANYESFAHTFTTLRLAGLAVLGSFHAVALLSARGHRIDIETVYPLFLGALFIVIGNVLGKIRPNWFVGIRTPWTLSSKLSWSRTHRVGGWVFVVVGLMTMVSSSVRASWAPIVLMVGVLSGVLALVVYSYVVWRGDPEKTPPAGTLPA